MKENKNLKKNLVFENTISEITSISLDYDYRVEGNKVLGNFIVDGTYKSHELSLNTDEFEFKIPFEIAIEENRSEPKIEVEDFTYLIDKDTLGIEIDYDVEWKETEPILFEEKEDFERFMNEHEVEDFTTFEPEVIEEEIIKPLDHIEEERPIYIEKEKETETEPEPVQEEKNDDTFITYHVYMCSEGDTLETISDRYHISIDTLKEYNDISEINVGKKILIPFIDE